MQLQIGATKMSSSVMSASAPLRRTYPAGRTLAEQAADAIRNGIIRGEFASGQALKEEELSSKLGVSRIPLREALRQLEGEGFVRIQPYCGAIVLPVSANEARELGEIRQALDCMALKLAIPQMEESQITAAEQLVRQYDKEDDLVERTSLVWQAFETLLQSANRPLLMTFIYRVHRKSSRYAVVFAALRKQGKAPAIYSKELFDACRKRDAEKAAAVLSKSLEQVNRAVVEYLEKAVSKEAENVPARRSRRFAEPAPGELRGR